MLFLRLFIRRKYFSFCSFGWCLSSAVIFQHTDTMNMTPNYRIVLAADVILFCLLIWMAANGWVVR